MQSSIPAVRADDPSRHSPDRSEPGVAQPGVGGAGATKGVSVLIENLDLEVNVGNAFRRARKQILSGVSVTFAPGEFVGILGASGSGKSTLIKTMAGLIKASSGRVLFEGRSVQAHDLINDRRIAYLPQDVVIHEQLTIRRALSYICELKGVARSGSTRAKLIEKVARQVGVLDRLDLPIRRLSGGQRKRAALAAELIGDPALILLDEVTSGLDPATEDEMMRLFRSLANEGRTVVCITHFPNRLALCDRLIYLVDGKVVFIGKPEELQQLFGAVSLEEVYFVEASGTAEEWQTRWLETPAGDRAKREQAEASAIAASAPEKAFPSEAPRPARGARVSGITQFFTLLRRYFALQTTDWPNLLLLILQAPAIALMIGACYGSIRADFFELQAADTKEVIFLVVVAMLWCSGMLAVREIVKEQSINHHEVRFGLRMGSYLSSKLVLLSFVAIAQAAMLLWVVRDITEMTGAFSIQFLIIAVTSIVGITMGLLVSTVAGSSERAMTILPVILIMQAIFSGGITRPEGVVKWISQATVPAYWGLDGLRSTFSAGLTYATYPNAPGHFQPPILGTGGPLWLDVVALLILGGVICYVTLLGLNKKFVGRIGT